MKLSDKLAAIEEDERISNEPPRRRPAARPGAKETATTPSRRMAEGLSSLLPEDRRLRFTTEQAHGRTSWFARMFRRPASSSAHGAARALNPTNS